ncbi:solute carrier family 41 member 3 isoform X3 [Peromyscus maniculatus bairdii]|nr:solute carrier family 41 member 3 isoform X2 [Peromyscus maniculatus bairdii]XP_042129575.1 solute carrier family 41 member 3 isoform X2 [Peromyscus maniculatus bairdii]XP_042129576.1 solute carrier family 41 member 3 isoform X2 [Peromyscus maniculatus bairdii]
MEGTEARQRRLEGCSRPKELGPSPDHSAGRLSEASEDGHQEVSESQNVDPKSLEAEHSREGALVIGFQVLLPFLLAGLGLSWAGLLLNYFQHWSVFQEVKDLLTLVPPLVGLKGNLEMTLASRLSTSANTGQIDDRQERYRIISSNLAVVQVQATIVGLLAALASLLLGVISREELDWTKVAVLCTSSVITAFLAALALGILMICIVIGARKFGVNPDNIATPIAASLGDLITLSILALISSFFYRHRETWYLTPLVCVGFMALTPLWIFIAKQNPPIMKILKYGWFPIILAMVISSFGGLILSRTISKHQFKGMAVLTPVICGVGGNLVAIQTSRISTFLHMWSTPGVLPVQMKRFWPNPCLIFCSSEVNSVSARVLLFLVIPGHLIFFYLICLVEGQAVTSSKVFVLLYLVAAMIQVVILLYLAEVMVRLTWHQALDPDNHCIPYLTGLGDLLGTSLLALCFLLDWLLTGRADLAELVSELVSVPP